MLKTAVTLVVFVFHSSMRLVNAIDCQATDMAQFQLKSYYTWWYRLKNIFTKSNPLCSLDDENRKKLCAQVAKACYTELTKVKIEDVLQVVDTPTECEKYKFTTSFLKNDYVFWSREKKRMFACKQFTVTGIRPIAEFYLSAAGIPNGVIVFNKPSEKSPIIRPIRLVTGLSYQEEEVPAKKPQKEQKAKVQSKKPQEQIAKVQAKKPQEEQEAKDVPQIN